MKFKGELIVGILSFSATVAIASAASFGSVADVYDAVQGTPEPLKADTTSQGLVDPSKSSSSCEAQLTAQNPSSLVNLRAEPTIASTLRGYGLVGDRVSVLDQTQGFDGYTWYNVQFPRSRAIGWIRGDLLIIDSQEQTCTVQANTPNPSENIAPVPEENEPDDVSIADFRRDDDRAATPVVDSEQQRFDSYTQEEINFFLDIAMGTEFGGYSRVVRKWNSDIKVRVIGSPTSQDQQTLRSMISELNELLDAADPNSIDIELLSASSRGTANVEVYIVPSSQFRRYEPHALPGQLGFAWPRWSNNDEIYTSRIFVSSTNITQNERSHLLREEFTQSLGLMRDTEDTRYQSSIFYQWWTDTTAYTDLDRAIISMLYRPDVTSGMTSTEVASRLQSPEQPTVTTTARKNDNLLKRALGAIGIR